MFRNMPEVVDTGGDARAPPTVTWSVGVRVDEVGPTRPHEHDVVFNVERLACLR